MSNSRFSILITIYLACWGWLPPLTSLGHLQILPAAIAQTEILTPPSPPIAPQAPVEGGETSKYDSLMKEGNSSLEKKDFPKAIKAFSDALKERPEDTVAKKALEDAQTQSLQAPPPSANPNTQQPAEPNPRLFLYLGIGILSLVLLGTLAPFLSNFYRNWKKQNQKKAKKATKKTFRDGDYKPWDEGKNVYSSNGSNFVSDSEDEEEWNPSLPVQRTTRLPNIDLVLQLMEDLKDPQPRVRRRAIWKLAQMSDSRSMNSLLDTMIDTDSYDRSLILEALSQICIRTLRPMNQALAIALQDKNPQVRKNALRDLTRMYNVMAQISQLVAHATEDQDLEVQETARWAMKQLNLPAPIKIDIPETIPEENETGEEASYTESAELET